MGNIKNNLKPETVVRLRGQYREAWGRDWPYADAYLGELHNETRGMAPQGSLTNIEARRAAHDKETLILMRECHEFDPNVPAE